MECTTTVYTATNDDALVCPEIISTSCIVSPNPISYLNLSGTPSQTQINAALVLSLMAKDQLIAELNDRITILETP